MQELDVPNALIHNDINGGNILLRGTNCIFTDWAEACIGNPFLTFQHLCAQISRDSEHAGAWLPQVKHAYKKAWIECLTEAQIDLAFALMPILGITSYLYGRGTWLNSTRRDDQHFQSYSRSLARYMDRAARAPELLEALCH
jgi:aminoglycoside phosphotransferase (APT) family kinase protein